MLFRLQVTNSEETKLYKMQGFPFALWMLCAGIIIFLPDTAADPLLGLVGGEEGVLSGILGDDGLLGLGGLLEQVLCLLRQLGLGIVEEIVRTLGLDVLLGLNEIMCEDGGDQLLEYLYTDGGELQIDVIPAVLCTVKALGLNQVNRLLADVGLAELLRLHDIVCKDGVPLLDESSTCATLLIAIIDIYGVDSVFDVGFEDLQRLDVTLTVAGILDVNEFLRRVGCLLKKLKLKVFIELLETHGLDVALRFNDLLCQDGGILLLAALSFGNGDLRIDVIPQILCLVESLGIGEANRLLAQNGLINVLQMYGTTCGDGPVIVEDVDSCFYAMADLLSVFIGRDAALEVGLKDIFRLFNLPGGTGIQTLRNLLKSVSCLLENIGISGTLDIYVQFGSSLAQNFNDILCREDGTVILQHILPAHGNLQLDAVPAIVCLAKAVGIDDIIRVLTKCGLTVIFRLGDAFYPREMRITGDDYCQPRGGLISLETFDISHASGQCINSVLKLVDKLSPGDLHDIEYNGFKLQCLTILLSRQIISELLDAVGAGEVERLNDIVCPNGMPSADMQVMAESDESAELFLSLVVKLGVDAALDYIKDIGPDELISVCCPLATDGIPCVDHLDYISCAIDSLQIEVVLHLLDLLKASEFLSLEDAICPDGKSLNLGFDAEILVEVTAECLFFPSSCTDVLFDAFFDYPCDVTCIICPLLETTGMTEAATECERLTSSFCY